MRRYPEHATDDLRDSSQLQTKLMSVDINFKNVVNPVKRCKSCCVEIKEIQCNAGNFFLRAGKRVLLFE